MIKRLSLDDLRRVDKSPRVDFHYRLIAYLRDELPEQVGGMDDHELLERIRLSEERGASYGVTSEAGVTQWVCLTFLAGPEFDEIPEVKEYLEEPEPDGEAKVDVLVDELGGEFQQGAR